MLARTAFSLIWLVGAVAFLSAQNANPDAKSEATPLPEDVARDAYDLYSSIYRNSTSLAPDEVLAIAQNVFVDPFPVRGCVKPRTDEERTMLENLIRLSRDPHVWEARFDFGRFYKLLNKNEASEAINCIHPLVRVSPKACDPYVSIRYVRYLSNPGFNKDHTRALFAFDRACGGLCGDGTFFVYRKTAKGWEEEPRTFATCDWVADALHLHNPPHPQASGDAASFASQIPSHHR